MIDQGMVMDDHAPAPETITFDRDVPRTNWIMALIVYGWLGYFIYRAKLRGTASGVLMAGLLCGVGVLPAAWWLRRPRVAVTVGPDGIVLREAWLWHTRERRYAVEGASVPDVHEVTRGNGRSVFRCFLRLPNGREVVVAEKESRAAAEEVRGRLLAFLVFA